MSKPPCPDWDAELYESKHGFVWEAGADLVSLLDPKVNEQILDLGCGTGQLTAKIAGSGAQVTGIDSSQPMVDQAKANYPSLRFLVVDALDMSFDEQFDAVFSNAVLHWIPEAHRVISRVWHVLKPSGRFVAELGGKGNVQNIVTAMHLALEQQGLNSAEELQPWYFPDAEEYRTLLEALGFDVQRVWLFPRPTPLLGSDGLRAWLEMFGRPFLQNLPRPKREAVVRSVERSLRPRLYREDHWIADYVRLRIFAVKATERITR